MIKPNELRVGNKLHYFIGEEGVEWEVTTVDWQDIQWCSEDEEGFNKGHRPIRLTTEWLINFGYTKRESSVCNHWWNGLNNITHDWLVDITEMHDNGQFFYRNAKHVIKHVHQLQNLYFSLTGEELTFNE